MDYRNILATGFLLLCGGYFYRSLQPAIASMPVGMQHGQYPFEKFTDCDVPGASPYTSSGITFYCEYGQYATWTTIGLFTVPTDRNFIITGFAAYDTDCFITRNGIALVGNHITQDSNSSPLTAGNAHFLLAPGDTVEIAKWSNDRCDFYLEGYYAHL